MEQITRAEVRREAVRVGVDLAKRVIQVRAVDAAGHVLTSRALPRDRFIEWCARLPPGCIVAMEASSSAHHWARKLTVLGLDPRIISAQLVEPYRSQGTSGKNDANDAAAICEAASRPTMRFIPVKSVEQQSMLCVHRLREGLKEDRTACINRIRGLLAEFGLVFPQSPGELRAVLSDVLEDASNELGTLARLTLQRAQAQWHELDEHMAWCDERIAAHKREQPSGQGCRDADRHRSGHSLGRGRHGWRLQAVQERRAVRRLDRADAAPALERRQEQPGRHHQAGRHLPAHTADPRREVSRHDGPPTTGQDLLMGGRATRAIGMAEGRGGPGQQERPHPLGGDDARRRLRCEPPERQAHRGLSKQTHHQPAFLHDVKMKTR